MPNIRVAPMLGVSNIRVAPMVGVPNIRVVPMVGLLDSFSRLPSHGAAPHHLWGHLRSYLVFPRARAHKAVHNRYLDLSSVFFSRSSIVSSPPSSPGGGLPSSVAGLPNSSNKIAQSYVYIITTAWLSASTPNWKFSFHS